MQRLELLQAAARLGQEVGGAAHGRAVAAAGVRRRPDRVRFADGLARPRRARRRRRPAAARRRSTSSSTAPPSSSIAAGPNQSSAVRRLQRRPVEHEVAVARRSCRRGSAASLLPWRSMLAHLRAQVDAPGRRSSRRSSGSGRPGSAARRRCASCAPRAPGRRPRARPPCAAPAPRSSGEQQRDDQLRSAQASSSFSSGSMLVCEHLGRQRADVLEADRRRACR